MDLGIKTMTTPPNNVLPINADISNGARDDKGRWLRGPGRPLGSKNKQSSELARTVRALGPRAVAHLATAIDKQEIWATTLVIKFCLPGRMVELHAAEPEDVKHAFLNGEISADEMKQISTGLEKLKSIESIEELRARLTELEAMLNAQAR
jgi:hypothetical protein